LTCDLGAMGQRRGKENIINKAICDQRDKGKEIVRKKQDNRR